MTKRRRVSFVCADRLLNPQCVPLDTLKWVSPVQATKVYASERECQRDCLGRTLPAELTTEIASFLQGPHESTLSRALAYQTLSPSVWQPVWQEHQWNVLAHDLWQRSQLAALFAMWDDGRGRTALPSILDSAFEEQNVLPRLDVRVLDLLTYVVSNRWIAQLSSRIREKLLATLLVMSRRVSDTPPTLRSIVSVWREALLQHAASHAPIEQMVVLLRNGPSSAIAPYQDELLRALFAAEAQSFAQPQGKAAIYDYMQYGTMPFEPFPQRLPYSSRPRALFREWERLEGTLSVQDRHLLARHYILIEWPAWIRLLHSIPIQENTTHRIQQLAERVVRIMQHPTLLELARGAGNRHTSPTPATSLIRHALADLVDWFRLANSFFELPAPLTRRFVAGLRRLADLAQVVPTVVTELNNIEKVMELFEEAPRGGNNSSKGTS